MLAFRHLQKILPVVYNNNVLRCLSTSNIFNCKIVNPPDDPNIHVPNYEAKDNEELQTKRARLLYQSRKRGTLENGLLLSTFASKYLSAMNEKQMKEFDMLLNRPLNEWDIYYWATGTKPTPAEFQHEVMEMLQEHCKNVQKEQRLRQPDLY